MTATLALGTMIEKQTESLKLIGQSIRDFANYLSLTMKISWSDFF
jgi:hypothetical protein